MHLACARQTCSVVLQTARPCSIGLWGVQYHELYRCMPNHWGSTAVQNHMVVVAGLGAQGRTAVHNHVGGDTWHS
jgi:hypothetical protein